MRAAQQQRMTGPAENFLRRWSTTDITGDNAFLFEENLTGVLAIAPEEERKLLEGLSRSTPRKEFAERYRKLLNGM